MQVFYAPDITGKYATLSKTESIHCITVLRHVVSDTIYLIDGNGGLYKASITDPDPNACQLEITEADLNHQKNLCKLHIAIAPPKQSDRFEWFIEKAVEIGIDEITPMQCHRSERKAMKTDRLEKIIIASMKQAVVTKKPVINGMIPYTQFIRTSPPVNTDRYIAYCSESQHKPLHEAMVKGNNAIILIGPEGDFTPEEIQQSLTSGYMPVSLGSRRLRTETAALVGCVAFSIINS
jgi:16S rRNA (uracil1498-N3)-methyltransferase